MSALFLCETCGFRYHVGTEHGPEDCARARKTTENPCKTCGHGKHYHDGGFCVQAIAGFGGKLPSFCGMHDFVRAVTATDPEGSGGK